MDNNIKNIDRRKFVKQSAVTTSAVMALPSLTLLGSPYSRENQAQVLDDFQRPDSLNIGDSWESLNPGYWQIENNTLRRKLKNVGDRARSTGFPYHYETHPEKRGGIMQVDYDPSLPLGVIWNRHYMLKGSYAVSMSGKIENLAPQTPIPGDKKEWKNYQKGNGVIGLAFGANTQFEGFHPHKNNAWMVAIKDDQTFGIMKHDSWKLSSADSNSVIPIKDINASDTFTLSLKMQEQNQKSKITARLIVNGTDTYEVKATINEAGKTHGYIGIAARGLLDFSINRIHIDETMEKKLDVGTNECHSCYALGDTLKEQGGKWTVRFVSLFRNEGKKAEIRISDSPNPVNAWSSVEVCGEGKIVSNDFRRNTAIIDVGLPFSPSEKTMYYTIWKDGLDVTADPRINTAGVGLGTGIVGDVPASGKYVGRLPQLKAPYRICGLSCHAIHASLANLPQSEEWEGFYIHDQPTFRSYKHLEDYDFQVMLWEDDVWYMELLIYPPSTDDAYKIVTTSICGATSRWQMMRHWNVLNPGDHDHGMDDVKGPEQIALRKHKDLGQDPDYLIRNFQIVSHLMTGKENPSGTDNPKRWRKWKMPNRDFTLLIMDSRLWRSSQDTNMWDDEGWGHKKDLYGRKDPTRSLLGEEQFAWLQENIHTDTSPIICLTGINALHSIWKGTYFGKDLEKRGQFDDRDRVAADYAGWVGAGADRIIELLGSRDGIVSVYGDVHNGSIIKNTDHNLYECSFGPIGRSGGREVIDGFGPIMKDFDDRPIEAIALYHEKYDNVQLTKEEGPYYWNFLEMAFNPLAEHQKIEFSIRNLVDAPDEKPRGGNHFSGTIADTGRKVDCKLPSIKTLPNADVLFLSMNGSPIRGARSDSNGIVAVTGLTDVVPGEKVLMVSNDGRDSISKVMTTM